jgi:hypothetical protein
VVGPRRLSVDRGLAGLKAAMIRGRSPLTFPGRKFGQLRGG